MFENLPKYIAGAKIDIKEGFAYRADWVLFVAFQIVSPLIMIFVWTAIYLHTGVTTIGGFTLFEVYAYFFVVGAAAGMSTLRLQDDIAGGIQNGTIVNYLMRPLGYVQQLLAGDLSARLFAMAIISLPILIIITLLAGLHLSVLLVLMFVLELAVAYVIATLIGFILGVLSIYLTDIGGISTVVDSVALLFGGAIMPFTFLPSIIVSAANVLPFQFMFYVPASTFIGTLPLGAAAATLPVALAWILVLYACAAALWSRSKSRINAVGV